MIQVYFVHLEVCGIDGLVTMKTVERALDNSTAAEALACSLHASVHMTLIPPAVIPDLLDTLQGVLDSEGSTLLDGGVILNEEMRNEIRNAVSKGRAAIASSEEENAELAAANKRRPSLSATDEHGNNIRCASD